MVYKLNKMNNMEINLKGGIILIGSLFWDTNLLKNDELRKIWREKSLDIANAILSKLPIRYGRYSKSGIYTMVFSANCEKKNRLGTGYVIPFKKNPITTITSIFGFSIKLSEVEGMREKFACNWGALAILFNKKKICKTDKEIILEEWSKNFSKDSEKFIWTDYRFGKERCSISKKGELQISWPKPLNIENADKISNLDFLIATVTKPKHKKYFRYPSIKELSESVISDKTRKYFFNNFRNAIFTFQDINILNEIDGAEK